MRAKIFSEKLGWDVSVKNGLEIDRFDSEGPVYIIYQDQAGFVTGSCRLLPTTGPTLLAEVFGETMPAGSLLSSPTIWECTRFCVDYRASDSNGRKTAALAATRLVSSIGSICINMGVESVIGNFDRTMLKIYDRIGCKVHIIGRTNRFGKTVYLGSFPVDVDTVKLLNKKTSIYEHEADSLRAA